MRDRNGVIFIYFPVIPNVTSPGTIYHGWIQDCMESIMQYLGSPGVEWVAAIPPELAPSRGDLAFGV